MNDEEQMRIEKDLFVNEATLDYFKRKIESDVKNNLFRWVGLPVGGAGIIAILFLLFSWIPNKVSTIIETNTVIQKKLNDSAIEYLGNPEKGQKFIAQQIREDIEKYMQDPERGQRLIQSEIEKTAKEQIEVTTAAFFEEKGEPLIRELSDAYLKSPEVKAVITQAIDEALKPKISRLSGKIRQNAEKLVVEIETKFKDTAMIDKRSLSKLEQFIRSAEGRRIKRRGTPIALTISIRGGERYADWAIREYINSLTGVFGDKFICVLVLDRNGKFLAQLPPTFVKENVNNLLPIFNSPPQFSPDVAKREFTQMLGEGCIKHIALESSVAEALKSSVWAKTGRDLKGIAVLNEAGNFVGLTSRDRLIEGIAS
jgi:hypothetical protein